MALIMVFFDKDNLSNGLCILFCTQKRDLSGLLLRVSDNLQA